MPVNEYTNRELGILLEKLTEKIDDYHKDIDKRFENFESEIKEVKKEVEENKTFRTKAMAIVGIIAIAGGSIANKVLANLGL